MKRLIALALLLSACNHHRSEDKIALSPRTPAPAMKAVSENPTKPPHYMDSVLVFQNLQPSHIASITPLTTSIVKSKLYSYYRKQGCLIRGDYPWPHKPMDSVNTIVLTYDSTYFVNINDDKLIDAIVEYWLVPLEANGHGFMPHKAMVVSSTSGYALKNPEFIGEYFGIDSITPINNEASIFGSFCDRPECENRLRFVIRHQR